MTRHSAHVRAVLQRGDAAVGSETDQLAATLAQFWVEGVAPHSPLARFADTGEIGDDTVAALRRDLTRLEDGAPGESIAQRIVGCLLGYAEVRGPRGPVAGWAELRSDAVAARVLTRSPPAPISSPSSPE